MKTERMNHFWHTMRASVTKDATVPHIDGQCPKKSGHQKYDMKKLRVTRCAVALILTAIVGNSAFAQQTPQTEKEVLVMKFRKLTGADNVKLGINVSFEDIKNDLIGSVDNDKELTDAQKQELRKSAVDAYDRLDQQLKDFLNDQPKITSISEAAVFQVYDQAFTEAELKELIAFYGTVAGQKALKFLPTLSAQVQQSFQSILLPKVQDFITPKIKAEGEQLKQKIQDAKMKKP